MSGGVDHVIYAVCDLDEAAGRFSDEFGLGSVAGGRHPGWGTTNRVVPLGQGYVELVGVGARHANEQMPTSARPATVLTPISIPLIRVRIPHTTPASAVAPASVRFIAGLSTRWSGVRTLDCPHEVLDPARDLVADRANPVYGLPSPRGHSYAAPYLPDAYDPDALRTPARRAGS